MRTLKEGSVGKAFVRLVETKTGYAGLVEIGSKRKTFQDQNKDRLWETLQREAAKANPYFVGYDGAHARFLRIFPDGFMSQVYLGDGEGGERNYKLKAKSRLEDKLPLQKARQATNAGEEIAGIYQATNLLSPFEKMRVRDALRGPKADDFIRAAAEFTCGDRRRSLAEMERALKPYEAAKWTVVTDLPFLWRPDMHMFLKPTVTQKFAARVGHPFQHQYSTALEIAVYESLLDLTAETRSKLSTLAPRDNIDIQSFIWVVGEYTREDEEGLVSAPAMRELRPTK